MKFKMPFGGTMEIVATKEIPIETELDEVIEGVYYKIVWNGKSLPWFTETKTQANAIAFGCQHGAYEISKQFFKND